jgi:hypothetical protein
MRKVLPAHEAALGQLPASGTSWRDLLGRSRVVRPLTRHLVGGPERKAINEPSGLHMAIAVPAAGKVSL